MSDYREDSCSPDPLSGLSSLTHHCLLHAVEGIAPHGISEVLPQSGSHNISSFCKELAGLVHTCSDSSAATEELLPPHTIQNFYSDVITELEFAKEIEKALVEATDVFGIEVDNLHKICWDYYREAKKGSVSFPKWLSSVCTFRLWLVFNQCLDDSSMCRMSSATMNEVVRRLIELCCYTWNDTYRVSSEESRDFTFPQFLECITDYFDKFNLDTSLTAEVIADLVDETVHGVLKKGYLEKKGHVRRNWTRRWFVLKRTILTYYSRDKQDLKGQLVLNAQTEVRPLPDKGNRRYMFLVTCGATGKHFSISADDQKMRHDWMLAIKKAIALAKLTSEGEAHPHERRELEEALSGFFLLKYGTNQPALHRQDSDIRQMKHLTTKRKYKKIKKIAGILEEEAPPPSENGREAEDPAQDPLKEDYIQMRSTACGTAETFTSSSEDEEGYCRMERPIPPASYSSSVSSGICVTPSSAGDDSVLSFSLSISGQPGIQDDGFNTSAYKPAEDSSNDQKGHESKTGLEDSYYEECEVGAPRYVPGVRYADVGNWAKLQEADSPPLPGSQKTTPSHTSSTPTPPTSPQPSYLTILPSPKTTPSPEELPSPGHKVLVPPIPPRRTTSPLLPRPHLSTKEDGDLPPLPPPRTMSSLSPVSSPVHDRPFTPPPVPTNYRKISDPLQSFHDPHARADSVDEKDDVGKHQILKKCSTYGNLEAHNKHRPVPPPRKQ